MMETENIFLDGALVYTLIPSTVAVIEGKNWEKMKNNKEFGYGGFFNSDKHGVCVIIVTALRAANDPYFFGNIFELVMKFMTQIFITTLTTTLFFSPYFFQIFMKQITVPHFVIKSQQNTFFFAHNTTLYSSFKLGFHLALTSGN